MTVLQDILQWSQEKKRAAWQRDALRRLVVGSAITQQDVGELVQIVLMNHGFQAEGPKSVPLASTDLPSQDAATEATRLLRLYETAHVNALVEGQTIAFGETGLTVIYGDNGAGKSGYARILRRACRARAHGQSILPNVFAPAEAADAEAKIQYKQGDSVDTLHWRDDKDSEAMLSAVSFFDAECASVYVVGANDLAYMPFGLDLLPELVDVCQAVRSELERIEAKVENSRPTTLVCPQTLEGTAVHTELEALDRSSTRDRYAELADMSERGVARLAELTRILAEDPLVAAAELETKLQRIRALHGILSRTQAALSEKAVDALRSSLSEFLETRKASIVASEEAFSGQPLEHVGSETWRRLWDAARRYSEKVYPTEVFPFLGADSRCVLCQQPLSAEAAERMQGFERFIQEDAQEAAGKAKVKLEQRWQDVEKGDFRTTNYRDGLKDLLLLDKKLSADVCKCLVIALRRYRSIAQAKNSECWKAPNALGNAPLDELSTLIETMRVKAKELQASSHDDERKSLKQEYKELKAREWLQRVLDDVDLEIVQLKKLDKLGKAIAETQTNSITNLSTKLTNKYVTTALCERFADEMTALGASYLQVGLHPVGGKYGQQRLRITLNGALPNAETPRVLSEGEFRCIALAGFLAELATEASGSALVFDDPVSSLDHNWRRLVAERLVQEASTRQAIIFTHDLVFLLDIQELCEKAATDLKLWHLQRTAEGAGVCFEGLPWGGMRTKKRIGVLRDLLNRAKRVYEEKERGNAYELMATEIYGRLRETWERAVEEVLLGGAVMRFQRGVQTKQLRKLDDICETDLEIVDEGMTKSSRFLLGHDESAYANEPIPNPDELKEDIEELANWVAEIRRRRG